MEDMDQYIFEEYITSETDIYIDSQEDSHVGFFRLRASERDIEIVIVWLL